jgi:hypothetical protein
VIDAWKNWENGAILEASSIPASRIEAYAISKGYDTIANSLEDFLTETDDWFNSMFKNTDL